LEGFVIEIQNHKNTTKKLRRKNLAKKQKFKK